MKKRDDKTFAANFEPETQSQIIDYLEEIFQPQDDILKAVIHSTEENNIPMIHVGPFDGLHLEVLTRACGAKKAVEIGTLAGYSGICIARGLLPSGKLYTFEADPKHAQVAQKNFERADVASRIKVFVGPALDHLAGIESEGPFDLVFIDADKVNYPNYLKWAEKNLRTGGLVIGDNTFAFGHLADKNPSDPTRAKQVQALRSFNETLAKSPRFRATLLPTGEGLTVGVRI